MDPNLSERLAEVEETFRATVAALGDPDVIADPTRLAELGKQHSELAKVVRLLEEWRRVTSEHDEALELAGEDAEMASDLRGMAEDHLRRAEELEAELRRELTPRDPNDDKDVIVEIRAAAGGDEAAIWAGDLLRMYERYAERHRLSVEPMESYPSEAGGFTRVTVAVKGSGAFSLLKHEAGVHRVQRVPRTESQGRVHTSTATVAVLPEADEVEVVVDPGAVKVDVFRSQGPGGQSVNTTDSAVRVTHVPSGLVVSVQDEKSQLQNKEKAFRILRARLLAQQQAEQAAEVAGARRSQVGTGERSEKIRTYNFKENRVTDHRLGLTVKQLDTILAGELDGIVESLAADEQARRLASG